MSVNSSTLARDTIDTFMVSRFDTPIYSSILFNYVRKRFIKFINYGIHLVADRFYFKW